jgi:hypothetical protein
MRVVKHVMPILFIVIGIMGCSKVPKYDFSPKAIRANGFSYTACEGIIRVYSPSRNVESSSSITYEITFTDEFGQHQELKDLTYYSIEQIKDANYAMPYPLPGPDSIKYSNGEPFKHGDKILWGKEGDKGRAIYKGPGQWDPVPCG